MYLIGALFLVVVALFFSLFVRSARESMRWTIQNYILFLVGAFLLGRLAFLLGVITVQFIPDYWHPLTLFELGARTGGLAIEDFLFMMGIGGIASALPFLFWKPVGGQHKVRFPWFLTSCSLLFTCILVKVFSLSLIYVFLFSLFAGIYIIYRRIDLVSLGVVGMVGTMLIYGVLFSLFLWLYPGYVEETYVFEALSGVVLGSVPIEELFYAGVTGLFLSVVWWYASGARPSSPS